MKKIMSFGILLSLFLFPLAMCSMGCCREPSYEPRKVEKIFEPCRDGGRDVKPLFHTTIMRSNETTGGMKAPEDGCLSVVVGSADGRPTVLVASISCAMHEGPFYTVVQIVNPDRAQDWVMPSLGGGACPYFRFSVDTHVVGTVSWTPMIGKPWNRSDEFGWGLP